LQEGTKNLVNKKGPQPCRRTIPFPELALGKCPQHARTEHPNIPPRIQFFSATHKQLQLFWVIRPI
jgi:hypothetical protein